MNFYSQRYTLARKADMRCESLDEEFPYWAPSFNQAVYNSGKSAGYGSQRGSADMVW